MNVNLRLIYSICGLALHNLVLIGALIVLFVKDSERHMWMAFEQMQQYIMYMWIGLFIFCCLVTKNRDYIYQYGLGLIIAVVFTWMIVGSYTRNTITMVANQIGQVSLRYYVAGLFKPVDMASVHAKLDESIRETDRKRREAAEAGDGKDGAEDSGEDEPEVVMREVLVAKGKKRR